MLGQATRGGMALLLCAAIGCQELHEISKYDPLIWRKPPGSDSENAIAAAPTARATSDRAAASPRLPSQDAEPSLHYVSYAPVDSGQPASSTPGDSSLSTSVAAAPDQGGDGLLSMNERSRAPKAKWSDSLIVRGQTPLRQVFASDRVVLASIIIAAIIIPFAIHDSRQANPPLQYQ